MRYLRNFYINREIAGKFIKNIEFAPITVFCGSGASGKTTLLNFIYQNLFNEFFDEYFEDAYKDKFFDENLSMYDEDEDEYWDEYERIDKLFEKHFEWYQEFMGNYKVHNSNDTENYAWDCIEKDMNTGEIHAVFDSDENGCIMLPINTLVERNSELLLKITDIDNYYWDYNFREDFATSDWISEKRSDYRDYDLCILDMPELGLSIDKEIELVRQIEKCAHLYGVQFIIATQSPVIASVKEAKIYDIDLDIIRSVEWNNVNIVKQYRSFFKLI